MKANRNCDFAYLLEVKLDGKTLGVLGAFEADEELGRVLVPDEDGIMLCDGVRCAWKTGKVEITLDQEGVGKTEMPEEQIRQLMVDTFAPLRVIVA